MCPPGVDQTTRVPPLWTLLAPKIKQQEPMPIKDRDWDRGDAFGSLAFLQDEAWQWGAFGKLARIGTSSTGVHVHLPALPSILAKPMPGAASSPLEMLAAELVDMIVTELNVEDQIALALCSTMLWCHVLNKVHATYRTHAPWAGTPIICTSTWLTELPKPLEEFSLALEAPAEVAGQRRRRNAMSPARRWNWEALSTFEKFEDLPSLETRYSMAFEKHAASSAIPEAVQELLKPALKKMTRTANSKFWKLRNLDTHEVVRFEVTQEEDSKGTPCNTRTSVNGCAWLTLDFMLTLRICWGPSETYDESESWSLALVRLERGVWAGHRFDVVDAEGPVDVDGWRDVTEEIVAEANLVKQ